MVSLTANSKKCVPSTASELWDHHHGQLRDPQQIVGQWKQASDIDARLLEYQVRGDWWDLIEQAGITLLLTREYEHLVIAFSAAAGRHRLSYLQLPHPSGLTVDRRRQLVHIASTRNPNMIYDFAPCRGFLAESPDREQTQNLGVLLPVQSHYFPGSLYLHDLALIGNRLHGNAVGMNTVVTFDGRGGFKNAWWPRCLDTGTGPRIDKNYLQLNSIAAGRNLQSSFFSASTATPSARRPGHLNFPVDGRGVIFSGKTREVVATGLTRPHSARLRKGELWVDNSGYGEVGRVVNRRLEPLARLNGWTRGLCFYDDILFVGTSRVIPRYRRYAPGVDCEKSESGIHALDLHSGKVLGSVIWPYGNQIFAIEAIARTMSPGFPFTPRRQRETRKRVRLFFRGMP